MFSGIIESLGTVVSVEEVPGTDTARISINAGEIIADLPLGGSLAVNGVCLTAIREDSSEGVFTADLMGETLARTTLNELQPGSPVNLERCVPAGGRLDGHVVQGHVDGVGQISEFADEGAWTRMRISLPAALRALCVEKGSIALNGTSLTITKVSQPGESWVEVGLIPATLEATTFGQARVGDRVNVETDILAKYALGSAYQPPAETPEPKLSSIEEAIEAMRRGLPVIVVDDEHRENEGDLIIPAEALSDEWMGFIVRHTSGVICAPMPQDFATRLELPPMYSHNEDPKGTAYTVSCDLSGLATGISAGERAKTLRALADPSSKPEDFTRPGHVFPLVAVDGGVRERPGHTEAGVELARLAGMSPVAVIGEIVRDDGEMMRLPELKEFGATHGLPVVTIEALIDYLNAVEVQESPEVPLPTSFGEFSAQAFLASGQDFLLLRSPKQPESVPLVRVHSECLTGDVFGSQRCDCGEQLHQALEKVSEEGGAVLYVQGHEGRGIGLVNKIRAYALQDEGADTVEANEALGFPADARTYEAAARVLAKAGLSRIRLLTNNPAKAQSLRSAGIDVVACESDEVPPSEHNARYLETKRTKMHHTLKAYPQN